MAFYVSQNLSSADYTASPDITETLVMYET